MERDLSSTQEEFSQLLFAPKMKLSSLGALSCIWRMGPSCGVETQVLGKLALCFICCSK